MAVIHASHDQLNAVYALLAGQVHHRLVPSRNKDLQSLCPLSRPPSREKWVHPPMC